MVLGGCWTVDGIRVSGIGYAVASIPLLAPSRRWIISAVHVVELLFWWV